MQLPYDMEDPHLQEDLLHIFRYALEAFQPNSRVNMGSVTLSCTANQLATQSVTFMDAQGKVQKPFKKGTTPFLFVFVNPSVASSTNKPSYTSLTNTGFTAQVMSDTTQTVTYTYLAIGQV